MRFPATLLVAASLFAGVAVSQAPIKVIFIAHGGTNFTADVAIRTYLEGRYGKANVTFQVTEPSGTVKAETILGYDVAVLSSSPSSGRYRGILHNSTTPIVNMEEAVADNNVGGEFAVTSGRTKETETGAHSIVIGAAHPITSGFTPNQKVQITTGPAEVWWSTGAQAPNAVSLAADDDTATNMFLTYVEAGGTLLDSSKAPCRRVMFGMTDHTFNFFTAAGKQLFGQAVDWAAGACCAQRHNYGDGLAGKNGVPSLTANADPKFQTTISISISNSSGVNSPCLVIVGSQPISVPLLGGQVLVNPTFEAMLAVPVTGLSVPFQVPNMSALCGVSRAGLRLYAQALQIDPVAKQGVSFTPGLRLQFGR